MGSAVGDEDAIGAGGDAEPLQPEARRFAVTIKSCNRAAGTHEAGDVAFGHVSEDLAAGRFVLIEINTADDGKIEHFIGAVIEHHAPCAVGHARLDECTAADLAAEEAEPLRLLVGKADGLDGKIELAREIPVRGHAIHRLEHPGIDVGNDPLGQRRVLGDSLLLREAWSPDHRPCRRHGIGDERIGLATHEIDSLFESAVS